MQKKIILIFCLLLLSGCKQVNDNNNYIDNVYACLNNNKITNEVALGYKYYLPKGVRKLKDYDYNQIFLVDDSYLYLYVDVVSFFHDKQLQENAKDNVYYYETFNYKDKKGYLLIRDNGSQYYFNLVYNYAKIEGYVPKKKINKYITIATIIANSVDYNKAVIEKIIIGDLGEFSEFTYEVKKPEGAESNFSQYLEEYVQKDEEKEEKNKLPDE